MNNSIGGFTIKNANKDGYDDFIFVCMDIETGLSGFEKVSIVMCPSSVFDRFYVRIDGYYSSLVKCDVYSIDGNLVLFEPLMNIGDALDISMDIGSIRNWSVL